MKSFNAGSYERHFWKKEYEYQSFVPTKINHEFPLIDKRIPVMIEEAMGLLGELNAYTKLVPDVDAFIRMHVRGEAVSSSAIEGTKTGIEESLLSEDAVMPKRLEDWREVQNYMRAMQWGVNALARLPVSLRFILGVHKRLLKGVRGEEKRPGEIRRSQNWVGGSTLRTAQFIPPHHERVLGLISDWEALWHNRRLHVPNLVRIAIGHYQFETIHPFLDGNGRVGRLLIIHQLIERGLLSAPVLYLSAYFERNRSAYYDALDRVRSHGDIGGWIRFFLEGVIETARRGGIVFADIAKLRGQYKENLAQLGRKKFNAQKLLKYLFANPSVTVAEVADALGIHYDTANELVADLVRLRILEEITGQARNRRYQMSAYVDLFKPE